MRVLLIILLLTFFLPAVVFGQKVERSYSVRHYTSENGLPQNSIRSIIKDREGFIWLGTDHGLARFDGQSFVTFNRAGLHTRSNQFLSFASDLDGRTDRIYAITAERDHIKISTGWAKSEENLLESHFPEMPKGKGDGSGWSYSIGLPDRFDGKWPISKYLFPFPGTKGSFYLWQTGGKIDLYEKWKKQKSYNTRAFSPFQIFRIGKKLYHDDGHGNIELLVTTQETTEKVGKIALVPKHPDEAKPDLTKAYKIYSDGFSGQTFIYQKQKLFLLSNGLNGHIQTNVIVNHLDIKQVFSIFFDEENKRLFIGTLNDGLYILDIHIFETLTVDSEEPDANIFYSHVALSDSTVLTPSFSVLGKGKSGQRIVYQHPRLFNDISLNNNSLLVSQTGDIWYMKANLLYWFDRNSKMLKGQWDAGGESSLIYEDGTGRIWFGTRKNGLLYVDPKEERATLHKFKAKLNDILFILEESEDVLWVATGAGLFKISRKQGSAFLIPQTVRYSVRSLYIHQKGELWFTTYENGLFLLKGDQLTRLPLDRNNILLSAHCFTGDKSGFFWITTNHGLFRINRKDALDFASHKDSTRLYYHRYSRRHGFKSDEFNSRCEPCAVRLKNGYFSLPSINGLVFFKPEQVPISTPDSKIFIDKVEANSIEVPVNGSQIELKGVNDVKVSISSPYFGDRENQRLYYTVFSEGKVSSKKIWYPIENEQQSIILNNLASGVHTVEVRKNAGFGSNNEQSARLTIVIPYAWYESWLFKMAMVTLVILTLFYYYRSRLKKATRLNWILDSRVSQRTQDLQNTLAVLKASESELQQHTRLQMHLIASISHDIRSPLRSIEFTSAKLSGIIDKGDYELARTIGLSVNESSQRILSLLENILIYVKSQVSGRAVMFESFRANGLVGEVAHIFKDSFALQQNRFVNNVSKTTQLRSNRQLLKIILHNLIDNANKYTSGGEIIVSAKQDGQVISLLVSDTGPGLPEGLLNWFNKREAANSESAGDELNLHGIGLLIVKELAEMLHLEITVKSNRGTHFCIRIPQEN